MSNPDTFNSNLDLRITNSIPTTGVHAASDKISHWKVQSTLAVQQALSGSRGICLDAQLLLVLLCSLASSAIPLDLLRRGASPRRRWSTDGQVEEIDALHAGLRPEFVLLLSSTPRLNTAFCELVSISAVVRNADQTYTLDQDIRARVLDRLAPEFGAIWRLQALIVAYRSIPWKYLEPCFLDIKETFIPHLRHTLQSVQKYDGFKQLGAHIRSDLILTLIEASRFSSLEWKRCAVSQAKNIMGSLTDKYLQSCIAQRDSLLYRITGNLDMATQSLGDASFNDSHMQIGPDKRMHARIGQTIIQYALNHVQVEQLAIAKQALEAWQPLNEIPSQVEEVTMFRKCIILGRISRFQGDFEESLAHLDRSKNIADQCKDLFFDEDRCDLVCSLADTLQELDEFVRAERDLRTEIARRGQDCTSSGRQLRLALAESLFSQGRHDQAGTLCSEIEQCPSLLKMERLRLSIVRAKMCHLQSDYEGGFHHWTTAMQALERFTMTNGHTTRIVLLSICDILRHQGEDELEHKSRDQFTTLESLAGSARPMYWIAGMRQWLDYLQSSDR